jgi:hypothetical protein
VIPKSKGWPVPAYGGVCGRLEVVAFEGEPLSSLRHIEWHRKLKYARDILNAAMDFTFKHDRCVKIKYLFICLTSEELNGSTVSALGIRSRKLSNVLRGQS